ncbi:ferrous iron transport protein B [Kamptonema cortianum]|nr:ferrous iron transport protein B [Geitlerinema splendidum]MDK3158534.1 ferrous iron transport protein B [Kamptonema cortianum]
MPATKTASIALIGNPNAGKTSLFNALTGSRQKIGNYPGVTVEKVTGTLTIGETTFEVHDVPGLYSLTPVSTDERVATQVLTSQEDPPDLVICVIDASNLERNLFLFSQLADTGLNVIVALTMTDVVAKEGGEIDLANLSSHLSCEVVPVVAHKKGGIHELHEAIQRALAHPMELELDVGFPQVVSDSADRVVDHMNRRGVALGRREARCVLLDEHCTTAERFQGIPELWQIIEEERKTLLGVSGRGKTLDSQSRYAWAAKVRKDCYTPPLHHGKKTPSERIDAFLTNRVFGLTFFIGLMYLVFQSIYTFAGPLMDLIEAGKGLLADSIRPLLAGAPAIQSLVVDGIIEGVGAVVVFLPQIIILFFFIAVLEGTGYLARAAFLMDKLLGWCGLNGRAFIPLLSSFACAIPGVMSARVMPDQKSRLITVLVAPLMSCSARLPVYLLIIGAIIEPRYGAGWAGFSLFAMHFVGLFVAIPVVFVLNRGIERGPRLPFMLELPKYQWPRWKDVFITIGSRAKVFLQTAGTIIFAMSILIWALLYFPRGDESAYQAEYARKPAEFQASTSAENFATQRQREDSILGRFGRAIEPVFVPAGFDWRLTTSILAAFPAREVVVPAMGILFGSGEEDTEGSVPLQDKIQSAKWPSGDPLMNPLTAASFMVFFALCCQCMATLATIKRETNSWKWAIFAFSYMTILAYIISVAIQQFGRFFI